MFFPAAGADSLTIRRHRPEPVLQRRQPAARLRAQLHVHTQGRHSAERHRRSRFGRRGTAR